MHVSGGWIYNFATLISGVLIPASCRQQVPAGTNSKANDTTPRHATRPFLAPPSRRRAARAP
jgi:hypothetical protein